MAWNEPGSGKQRDPWKDSGGGGPSPDFDALLRRIGAFFNRLFSGGGGPGVAILAIALVWVAWDSSAIIKANESGVVLRFGLYAREMAPGFNLKWPRPIETVSPTLKRSPLMTCSESTPDRCAPTMYSK